MIPIIGLVIGVAAGIHSGFSIPYGYSAYVAVGILACMDSVLGGVYANTQKEFEAKIFLSGFFCNGVLAVMLIWLGNQLSIDLSIAAIVVYGSRIFNNLSQIRHYLLRGRKAEEK